VTRRRRFHINRNSRIALLAAAAVVAVVAIVIIGTGGGDGNDSTTAAQTTPAAPAQGPGATTPPKPAIQVITVKNGKAVGGVQTVSVKNGDRARFKVVSDADHEIHLHGFDIAKDVKAGGSVTYNVKTDAPGIYEFEIEDTKTKIGQVKVEP
jgi:plastocyanin